MNWKFWNPPKEARAVARIDPDSAAYEGVRLVIRGRSPSMDYWREYSPELPRDVVPYLERCVWAYQLQILCDEVSRRFGPVLGDSVKGNALNYFSIVPCSVNGEELFGAVTRGRAMYRPGAIPQFADTPNAERSLVIANAFFEISDIPEEGKTGIWVAFAKCLGVGGYAAEKEFASFLDGVSISQTPALIWSRAPGCFERHLQRRFANPLFDANRREVSRAEMQEARVHDLKDVFAITMGYRDLLPQLISAEETTFDELANRSFRCDALKEKMAQAGGDWAKEKEVLDIASKEIRKLISTAATNPRLDELSQDIGALNAIKQIPFGAQATRDETPIQKSEVISALLTEDLETIRAASTVYAAFGLDFRAEAQSIIDRALREGLPQADAHERLNALMDGWASGRQLGGD
jgi:hypothetical protein